jgi:hypothetical protein
MNNYISKKYFVLMLAGNNNFIQWNTKPDIDKIGPFIVGQP